MDTKWFLNTLRTSQSHRSQCSRFYSQDKERKLGKHANITKKGYRCTDLDRNKERGSDVLEAIVQDLGWGNLEASPSEESCSISGST